MRCDQCTSKLISITNRWQTVHWSIWVTFVIFWLFSILVSRGHAFTNQSALFNIFNVQFAHCNYCKLIALEFLHYLPSNGLTFNVYIIAFAFLTWKINSDIIQSPVEHALVMWVRFLLNIDGIIKSGKTSTEIQRHPSINMLKLQFIVWPLQIR